MMKYSNLRQLSREKGLSWLTVSEGLGPPQRERHGCRSGKLAWQAGGGLTTFHSHTGSREQEQEVGPGYKAPKPSPNDTHPPTRLYGLRVYNRPQQNYQPRPSVQTHELGTFRGHSPASATFPLPAIPTLSSASLRKIDCGNSFLRDLRFRVNSRTLFS